MEYNFRAIEKNWQEKWTEEGAYQVPNLSDKPKYYVLDMFPYPSGAGLHVGHPLGYIASDIFARYKRLKGFNVLHPMGYDAFGLPAEQYAIEHGVHPAVSTSQNINNFRSQLDKIGFSFDWSREVNTSDPKYYKWTQWIFLQLFKSWYNRQNNRTESIDTLIQIFEQEGNAAHPIPNSAFQIPDYPDGTFTPEDWNSFPQKTRQAILMEYRIAYCGYGEVNWCEALGTVLANDEVINGVSERGGYPVVKKKLRQWYLRITEYADRLLEGLQKVDFSDAMKEMQSNWIGKSVGAEIRFEVEAPSRPSPEGKESQSTTPRYQTAQNSLYAITKNLAKEKRANPTHEEMLLWERVKNNQTGFHIRRQHIIGSYIVDFACLDKLVTIEIDGGYHNNEEIKKYDTARTKFLEENGFTELRYTNDQVRNNITDVIDDIVQKLKSISSVPKKAGAGQVSPSGGDLEGASLTVYTTRPDTIFGVDFMVLAPEHELVPQITTSEQQATVDEYISYVRSRSERERMAEKKISGVFTGGYAIHPFTEKQIPIWISEYVLAGYGTGAIMAVPSGDERDHKFAQHFNLPITNIFGDAYTGGEANAAKNLVLHNSDFLNGMAYREAMDTIITRLEEEGIGQRKVNYKMRDAAFSRQRYWGEPFPIVWKDGIAYPLSEDELPLQLPHVESYKPGPEGEGPLANIPDWTARDLETNTMPGYAGSSWYFLRYMDPHNEGEFCDKRWSDYWNQVDLYVGGTEHAVGHLLYSRMWVKALYDLNLISFDEPYKKLLNQGMIQGSSRFVYRLGSGAAYLLFHKVLDKLDNYNLKQLSSIGKFNFAFTDDINKICIELHPQRFIKEKLKDYSPHFTSDYTYLFISDEDIFQEYIKGFDSLVTWIKELLSRKESYVSENYERPFFVSYTLLDDFEKYHYNQIHVDVNIVDGVELDREEFKKWRNGEYANAQFILEDGKYICGTEVEKMSKSKFNTVNPDNIVEKYGADTFRMYEMFLGPVEMSKPWDTKGIEGVHRFLKKLWRLFFDDAKGSLVTDEKATPAELKILHRTIKKVEEDTERFSYNTAVSAFMVCINELTDLGCHKREVLAQLLIILTPYAPHISEELWHQLGHTTSILDAAYPPVEEKYLIETTKEYPVSINGKMRTQINMSLEATQQQVEETVLANLVVQKWMEGKPLKKFIFVQGKMVNVVV